MISLCSLHCIASSVSMVKAISSVVSTQTGEIPVCYMFLCITLKVVPTKKPCPSTRQDFCLHTLKHVVEAKQPPEAMDMIGAGGIRLTVSFPLCLLWEILLPNVWQECHMENRCDSGKSCQPWHLTHRRVRAATSAFHLRWLLDLSICLFKGFPFPQEKLIFPSPWPSQ